jgi:hypothetical protein
VGTEREKGSQLSAEREKETRQLTEKPSECAEEAMQE